MKTETKSYTLRMPSVLLSRLDIHSRKNGMTQAQVVIQACRQILDPDAPYMAPSTPAGKMEKVELQPICPRMVAPELTAAGPEAAGVEPVPVCMACEGSTVEGQGKSAGRWACQDVSCPRYGIEVK